MVSTPLPAIAQDGAARGDLLLACNSPSNFASSDSDRVMCSLPPAETSAELSAGRAPKTTKLDPGRLWKATPNVGVLMKSCAQAARP
jgi:hypothetical protein